ncbi:amidohydrolase family protein [Sphingosinicella sp. LHD-64]|uniref:amidohydrolase family protein n=1 Tax=Sphingosinicella sp. LHD-64 TaxID=3072139 RepID=UPI00280D7B51|nr:amidohydrolase family protein [Sphingosinicella sp. LHD-64]MDQ8757894.1 amidohydrolase family protein [Sphingosinicella sp. LHD-64]
MKALGLLLAGVAALAATPAVAQTIAITGGRVVVGDGSPPIDGGTVVIRNGRVVAAGAGVNVPAGATTVDASGKWVTPGLVAGFSRIGLTEVDAVDETNDISANNSPFNAAIDVVPAINPQSASIAVNRAAGITRAVVSPGTGRSIFAGQGAVIDLGGDMEPITRPRLFQFIELGETGAEDAGGSRAAAHVMLRNALREARDLRPGAGRGAGPNDPHIQADARRSEDVLLTRFDAAALVPVLQGRQLLLVHVERASDLLQTLALREEFPNLRLVLIGATEGWRVADRIAAARVPVIANALNDLPSTFEQLAATQSNVGRMRAAGVNVALGMINDDETRQIRLLTQYAGNLVGIGRVPGHTGLSWDEAFASLSAHPAEAIGLADEIGSLRPGRRADVVIWDGDPLELATGVDAVWIDGVQQDLTNRQTRLRDRYRQPQEGALPHAYDPR